MVFAIIWLIVCILIWNILFAWQVKEVRIVKSKRAKILILIPPVAFIILIVWAFYELFKKFSSNYFKSEE
jgi:hypothetical protein